MPAALRASTLWARCARHDPSGGREREGNVMLLATLIAIPLLLIWVLTVVDVLRRHDLRTSSKVLWALVVLLVPVVGVIVYFVARPAQATDRPETLGGPHESFDAARRRRGPV